MFISRKNLQRIIEEERLKERERIWQEQDRLRERELISERFLKIEEQLWRLSEKIEKKSKKIKLR